MKGSQQIGRESNRRIRVLAVGDDPGTLTLLHGVIQERRLPVDLRIVRGGFDVYVEAFEFRPEILFINGEVSEFNGIALCYWIHRTFKAPRPKVIFNMPIGPSADWTRALRAGADRFLPAPFRMEELQGILEDLAGYPD